MEIVRQRRKRLLAWILTLVLCVGMWQGSVMAEGEDGGDGDVPVEVTTAETTQLEGNGESNEPVVVSDTTTGTEIYILENVYAVNEGGERIEGNIKVKIDDVEKTFPSNETVNITGKTISGGELEQDGTTTSKYYHKVIAWRNGDSGSYIGNGSSLNAEDTLKYKSETESSTYYCSAYAVLGKSVKYIISDISDFISQSSLEEKFNIPLPEVDDSIDGIFKGWYIVNEEGDEKKLYNGNVEKLYSDVEFETCIQFEEYYTNEITEVGTYMVYPGKDYFLGSSSDLCLENDGYTYKKGVSFYVVNENQDGEDIVGQKIIFKASN